jgi:predicted amino acid racemase
MSGLHLDIDLDKIGQNARCLVDIAAGRGVTITAITKALLGEPQLARTLSNAGVAALGDSRIENIERMRHAHVTTPMVLIRSPMPSQIDRVVRSNTISVNSDLDVLSALGAAARVCGRVHDVIVMVELGDLRDGVMVNDLHATVRHILRQPSLRLHGIGTNLACRSGVEPTDVNMGELSDLVETLETTFGVQLDCVSGGNSANLGWMTNTTDLGRVNNLRLGESILLGRDPLNRRPIAGLQTNAITLVGEVIESHRKPTQPWGRTSQNAFGETFDTRRREEAVEHGEIWQTIVAAGRQDTDPRDLMGRSGVTVLDASSDHLILETTTRRSPGAEIRFEPGYSALLRSMTSPFVSKHFHAQSEACRTVAVSSRRGRDSSPPAPGVTHRSRLTLVPRPPLVPPHPNLL